MPAEGPAMGCTSASNARPSGSTPPASRPLTSEPRSVTDTGAGVSAGVSDELTPVPARSITSVWVKVPSGLSVKLTTVFSPKSGAKIRSEPALVFAGSEAAILPDDFGFVPEVTEPKKTLSDAAVMVNETVTSGAEL